MAGTYWKRSDRDSRVLGGLRCNPDIRHHMCNVGMIELRDYFLNGRFLHLRHCVAQSITNHLILIK